MTAGAPASPTPDALRQVQDAALAAGVAGRRVLVTGASSGIGQEVAAALVAGEARVVVADRSAPTVPDTHAFEVDLTDPGANAEVIVQAARVLGGLDALVPCAGFQHVSPISEFPLDEWQRMLALMLTSPFVLLQAAWPLLAESGSGRFVPVASAHAVVASQNKSAYVAAKHGLLGLVKTAALEGAALGITATAVCPGYVRTPLVTAQVRAQAEATGRSYDDVLVNTLLTPHAVLRLIEPSEVVLAVLFALGPAGAASTGSALMMDAGWAAR